MTTTDLESSNRRDRLYIFADILAVAKKGAAKTRIMYRANLSFKGANEYINFMLKTQLLRKTLVDNRTIYQTTEKGQEFFTSYNQLLQLIHEDNGLTSSIQTAPPYLLIKPN